MKKISLAPRGLLAVIAIAVLLITAATPAVSAYDQLFEINDVDISSFSFSRTTSSGTHSHIDNDYVVFADISQYSSVKTLYFQSVNFNTNFITDDTDTTNHTSATFSTVGGEYIGKGELYYLLNYNPDNSVKSIIIWFEIDEWNIDTLSGRQAIKVTFDKAAINGLTFSPHAVPRWYEYGSDAFNDPKQFGFGNNGEYFLLGHYTSLYGKDFQNTIGMTKQTGYSVIDIIRNPAGKVYPSQVIIYYNNHIAYDSWDNINDKINVYPETDIKVSVKSYTNDWYNTTFVEAPITPPASVTVYVRNSQTGALIADANIAIDALVDGEYYPVTNRTEPSGIFTITLQPTGGGKPNPDGYRLIVTADGYNNPMPEINFTVDDYKQSIYCLLDPIAGGPVNENKTFIDFFVRDMSSNPISGVTVKFGKYTLITNSAGYTVFEVDKNNNYSWTISKSGYGPLTGNAVIGDAPRHTINTVLAPIVTPTTTTPIPTSPPIGPTPTMTAPTGEPVSNWLEWCAAHFGMILGGGVEIGKIFMWLCFTVPVGVYVGKEAKAGAAGFMAGSGIVTLFFVLIGWVPIWLVVLLALIIGLLYAKEFNSPDNGGGR